MKLIVGLLFLTLVFNFAPQTQAANRKFRPTPSPQVTPTPTPTPTATTTKKFAIHTGGYSMDNNSLTQAQIDKHVAVIVQNIPSAQYIAVGTYLDYPGQIKMWADSIHAKGRKFWLRSAGFNSWQGTFGAPNNGTPAEHRQRMVQFLEDNHSFILDGDIIEVVPDEPENGSYWPRTYGSSWGYNTTAKADYNAFIKDSLADVKAEFVKLNITGVELGYVGTSASTTKDIITPETMSLLTATLTDDFPEMSCGRNATTCANAMRDELTRWVISAHTSFRHHINFGPSVYVNLSDNDQKAMYTAELNAIKSTVTNLDGLTIWQSGTTWNANSRLFNYNQGNWAVRPAASVVNQFYATN